MHPMEIRRQSGGLCSRPAIRIPMVTLAKPWLNEILKIANAPHRHARRDRIPSFPLRLELGDQTLQTPSFGLRKEQRTAGRDQPLEARMVEGVARRAAELPGEAPFVRQRVVSRVAAPEHAHIS